MIDLLFQFANEFILVRIEGSKVLFSNTAFGNKMTTIDGLKLDYKGVCREFPDLETNPDWKKIAIERFKNKINGMSSEEDISNYIIEDLRKHGYIPKSKQRKGFRIEKIK